MGTLLASKTSKDGSLHKVLGTFSHARTKVRIQVPDTSGVFQPGRRVRTLGTVRIFSDRSGWPRSRGSQLGTYHRAKVMAGYHDKAPDVCWR